MTGHHGVSGPSINPFELFGLDSDIPPKKVDPDNYRTTIEIPEGAWDAFAANRLDLQNLKNDSFPAFRGHWSVNIPNLPPRLFYLARWIRNNIDQSTALWWAAKQAGLHPTVKDMIKRRLYYSQDNISVELRRGWRLLFEAWENNYRDFDHPRLELEDSLKKDGWDHLTLRKFAAINRPRLTVCANQRHIPTIKNNSNHENILELAVCRTFSP